MKAARGSQWGASYLSQLFASAARNSIFLLLLSSFSHLPPTPPSPRLGTSSFSAIAHKQYTIHRAQHARSVLDTPVCPHGLRLRLGHDDILTIRQLDPLPHRGCFDSSLSHTLLRRTSFGLPHAPYRDRGFLLACQGHFPSNHRYSLLSA